MPAAVTSWGAVCLVSLLLGRGVLSSTLGAQRITSSEKACVSIWNIPEGLCGNPEVKFLKDSPKNQILSDSGWLWAAFPIGPIPRL